MDNNSLIPKTPDTLAVNLNALCRNSIELIQHARKIAVNQVNHVQLMTYYALGYWIVEEQQSGKDRAGYGKKVIQTLTACALTPTRCASCSCVMPSRLR